MWLQLNTTCPDCMHQEPPPQLVENEEGLLCCTGCGTVLCAEGTIDPEQEWRNFDDGLNNSRCGAAVDPFRTDYHNLRTYMGSGPSILSQRVLRGGSDPHEEKLHRLVLEVREVADRLGVGEVGNICVAAMECIPKMSGLVSRGKSAAHLAGAAVMHACRHEGFPREFKQVAAAVGCSVKQLSAAYRLLVQAIESNTVEHGRQVARAHLKARDLVEKIAQHNQLHFKGVQAAQMLADKLSEGGKARNPATIAAAAVFLTSKRAGLSVQVTAVAKAAGIATSTLQDMMKDDRTVACMSQIEQNCLKRMRQNSTSSRQPVVKVS